VCSDRLDGSAFGLSRSGGRTASSKSQRRHFQVSTVMGRDLLITCDLVITMVIPQLGHVLSGGGLSGGGIMRLWPIVIGQLGEAPSRDCVHVRPGRTA